MKIPKTWATVGLLLACAAVPYAVSGLSAYRIFDPSRLLDTLIAPWHGNPVEKVFRTKGEVRAAISPAVDNGAAVRLSPPLPPLPSIGPRSRDDWPPGEAEDVYAAEARGAVGVEDYGAGIPRFFEALERTGRKEPRAVTRISHFGDSPVTGDLIAGDARARLQRRFGDAGHGWIFVDRPWEWYSHRGVRLSGSGWSIQSPGASSGPCGLGGATFTASGGGARSRISTVKAGTGAAVGRFDIHFQSKPKGGTLLVSIDGSPASEISTASEEAGGLVIHSIPVADGGHELLLRPKGDGPVRLFGVVLEREVPGVVYDTLGANGATIRHLARFDRESWMDSLRQRRPDLVILNFGTNESRYAGLSFAAYARDYREVIRRVREAVPGAAILIMAPMDRGVRGSGGGIATDESIPRLVAAQRVIARTERVAFFDTYAAMGGSGTMADWYGRSPRLVAGDFTHPTHPGAAVLGDLLVDALLKGYPDLRAGKNQTPGEGATP